jgi:hypothetical protein
MALDMVSIIIGIVINVILISLVLWISGRMLVGGKNAKFTDAIWIVTLGAITGAVIGTLTVGIIGSLIQLIVWLYLVKHFFDCGWFKALAISIVAVVISAIILIVLGALGFSLLSLT